MSNSRVFRFLVCFLLVCCILINCSPLKAEAVDPLTLSAAAILGVTILGLSAYCGFVLAPPDVDCLEDVGEEFNEFLEVVISTGGMPDDDDDDTNNPVDDLIDQITSSTFDKVKVYTDAVGDALKGDDLIYDPAIAGGFAGCEAAFKLFLKWMIANGFLDRTVDVPAASGWSYYGDYLLPTFPVYDDRPYQFLMYYDSRYYMFSTSLPAYYVSSTDKYRCLSSYTKCCDSFSEDILEAWAIRGGFTHSFDESSAAALGITSYVHGTVLWSNHNIYSYSDGTTIVHEGCDQSDTAPEEEQIKPLVVLGPISGSIADGLTANGIPLPDQFNYIKLFDGFSDSGVSAVFDNINQIAQYLKDGTLTLDDYQDSLSYKELETPDETQPSTPVDDPDVTTPSQVPIDGTLGGAPVGDFLSNLGNLIMSPFQWIWNKIQSFFDPWITSIGNWFSDVRADIKSIPDKFETWFSDLIDGVRGIPDKILDGIKEQFPPTEPIEEPEPWEPSEDPGGFFLDLSGLFPFCIPFDLYDFLSCLNAEPEAPVISWEIALPGGGSYPLEIDLSPFNSVAQLLRRLQLLLFIVALGIKTRDLIKG